MCRCAPGAGPARLVWRILAERLPTGPSTVKPIAPYVWWAWNAVSSAALVAERRAVAAAAAAATAPMSMAWAGDAGHRARRGEPQEAIGERVGDGLEVGDRRLELDPVGGVGGGRRQQCSASPTM